METIEFNLEGEYIELLQLLKAAGIAQTGGHAKMMVDEGGIVRDGEVETRKRAKIRKGDVVEVEGSVEIIIK
ncbi:RNA-binding S4 domain-containing protein [Brumimicrobium oceani]|uniref:RNA-binding protein n=1 Tax=Brumimicrobium oceani TaxID=2100725 RepID=A0A2U2XDB1_9FLAO|nr:RNA-binding S4 domain-containing protein [Brumimicrobium oceani]PWH85789.1 RNA-binding protein [Brumimicrobium oceani]